MFYDALHSRLQYGKVELSISSDIFKKIEGLFLKAAKYIHQKGSFSSIDLNHKSVKPLITATYNVFKSGIDGGIKTEVPDSLIQKFQRDLFVFSGMKTYTQLKEASLLLIENGKIKPYAKFEQDILKINDKYNRNYLQTEYNYAVNSALSAHKYLEFAKDGNRYNLQIRTAQDDRVREAHAVLHNLTLPFDSPFWDTHWTPFDWGCRCHIIQVLKGKYEVTDIETAMKLGNEAVPEMFRYNPAKQGAIFPPKHPYYSTSKEAIKQVKQMAEAVTEEIKTVDDLNKVIKELPTDYFERGFKKLFAETSGRRNGGTDSNGTIALSSERMQHSIDAVNNIRKGNPTTFEQEDALSTLWHEITHNRNKIGSSQLRLSTNQRLYMEMANEFVSRNTLPQFMKDLGAELQNTELITNRKSTGYNEMVLNFDKIIDWVGADKKKVLSDVQKHLFNESYLTQEKGLRNAITNNSEFEIKGATMREIIAKAKDYPTNYFENYLNSFEKKDKSLVKK